MRRFIRRTAASLTAFWMSLSPSAIEVQTEDKLPPKLSGYGHIHDADPVTVDR